ncbi:ferritin-like domain-containing protein [Actinokineospora enzanensis]|uniref:ferritin-like domain-containing protein n=1 Tax=Actinokineospora enzanensis TaxID=155975 RepID=UPI000A06FB9C|nr:ferritin-like domain-containing protein [Actinokineospora enzanensis]
MVQPSSVPPSRTPLPEDTLAAVQAALGAEHAAVWVYGLVSAYLPKEFDTPIDAGAAAHRSRRDTTGRLLGAAGAVAKPAEPAYVPPKPVTDQASAMELVVTAEQDATIAWRSVLDHSDDQEVRRNAVTALKDAATRAVQWRKLAGLTPLTPPMPGQPPT